MLLSTIIQQMSGYGCCDIYHEKEFDTLSLTVSKTKEKSCVFLDNVKYLKDIQDTTVMVLTTGELYGQLADCYGDKKGYCITENPRELFFRLHNHMAKSEEYIRKRFPTIIGEGCTISPTACIANHNIVLGRDVTIEEFVVIRENTVIGDHSIIRAGAKIGGQGYEFKRVNGGGIFGVEHLGGVKIGEYVEAQYNVCIDRAVYPWDDTVVGNHTKIDNLAHIGHGVKVHDNVMIVAQAGIGGRTIIGDNTWIGFAATISNGLSIGKNARVNIGAVVTKDVEDGQSVTGNFAIDHKKFIQNLKASSNEIPATKRG